MPKSQGKSKPFRNRVKPHKKNFARKLRNNPTKSERMLWEELRNKNLGVKFRRQAIILGWIADFYCPSKKLIVELDGSYHERPGQPEIDTHRDQKLKDAGFQILRIESKRVFTDMTAVIAQINQALDGCIIE